MYGTNLANTSNFAFAFLHKILTSEAVAQRGFVKKVFLELQLYQK